MNKIKTFILSLFSFCANAQSEYPFTKEIEAFEQADKKTKLQQGQIMLYGSSTLRMWKSCEQDFAFKKLKIENRGFGGSQAHQAIYFFDRVVVPHRPSWLFFYEGDNDINSGKSVIETFQDYQIFINMVQKQLPKTKLVIFSIKHSPSRIQQLEKQKELNSKLQEYCKTFKNVYFLDTNTPMLTSEGKPDPKYFVQDMLHMNTEGYALWTSVVQKFYQNVK